MDDGRPYFGRFSGEFSDFGERYRDSEVLPRSRADPVTAQVMMVLSVMFPRKEYAPEAALMA